MCMHTHMYMSQHMCGDQRVSMEISSLLLPYENWKLNLGQQAWQQAPFLLSHLTSLQSVLNKPSNQSTHIQI